MFLVKVSHQLHPPFPSTERKAFSAVSGVGPWSTKNGQVGIIALLLYRSLTLTHGRSIDAKNTTLRRRSDSIAKGLIHIRQYTVRAAPCPVPNMSQTRYIRPFDAAESVDFGVPLYRAQTLSDDPSGLFLAITLEEGGCGPGLHYHHSDQIYFLTRGSVQIQLGDELHDVPTGSLIFIPAGTPHKNWNSGEGTEAHLEMLFPSPHRFKQLGYFIDAPTDVPKEWQTTRKAYVRRVEDSQAVEPSSGCQTIPLADPASGSHHVQIHHETILPDQARPTMHIHEFDQYYLVLEGELTVEVALQKHVARRETLVVLPAGVPYRQYNAGHTRTKHLAIMVPPPRPGAPLDVNVAFAPLL